VEQGCRSSSKKSSDSSISQEQARFAAEVFPTIFVARHDVLMREDRLPASDAFEMPQGELLVRVGLDNAEVISAASFAIVFHALK
jgi:hypothetical protein